MLRFDPFNKLFIISKNSSDSDLNLYKYHLENNNEFSPLLEWNYEYSHHELSLRKECQVYRNFELKLFLSALIQDLLLFRKSFKDCMMIGKFSFMSYKDEDQWKRDNLLRIDTTYNNGNIEIAKSIVLPEDYQKDEFIF